MSYKLSNLKNNFICGDSLSELDKLNENDINLVFTSPPYYNARPEYSFYNSYEEYLNFIEQIIKKIYKILQEGRFFIINVSPVIVPREKRSSSSKRLAIPFDIHGLFIKNGFEFIDDIIWQKPSGAGCGRGRRFYLDRSPLQYKTIPVTEYVLVYRKKSDKLIDWFIRNHPDQKLVESSKVEDGYETTNVWKINPSSNKVHPAIFPLELAERVIKYYSFKNDVVLDPFGGIGTTAIAAEKLERRYFLIEKEVKYIEEYFKIKNI